MRVLPVQVTRRQAVLLGERDGSLGTTLNTLGAKEAAAHVESKPFVIEADGIRRACVDALATAVRAFRHFSFVSGVVLDGPAARKMATDKWDGSEMYQMFLGCRMIAAR